MEPQQELDLELSLLHPASAAWAEPEPCGFFLCTYCGRKFLSSQALGGHQNAHKYERALAKRRREIAAVAMRSSKHGVVVPVTTSTRAGHDAEGAAAGGAAGRSAHPPERSGELDLSLRL